MNKARKILGRISFRKWMIVPVISLLVFFITLIFTQFPFATEIIYSEGLYRLIAPFFSFLSSYIPTSADDIFYLLLILVFFTLLLLMIFRKITWRITAKIMVNGICGFYALFYILWGFNYFRPGINDRLNLKNSQPDTEEFKRVLSVLIERTNSNYCKFEDLDFEETDSIIEAGYRQFSNALKLNYPNGKRNPKSITFSRFFARAGISGYFGPFFNEVHLNRLILPVEYPFVLAHEKAHQFGITNEAEANFLAWLVCSRSSSEKLRYSAYIQALHAFLYQASLIGLTPDQLSALDENVKADFKSIRDHWQELRDEYVDKAASKVYDTYLKTNKVEKGIEDYYGVVKFIMDFSEDNEFRKKLGLK